MKQKNNINFSLNKFLRYIKLKKQYIKELKNKISVLNSIKEKNYKKVHSTLLTKNALLSFDGPLIMYIVHISFTRTNTLLHVTDFSGKLKFSCSAGSLKYTGKKKKRRSSIVKEFYRVLVSKLKFLKFKPIAVHLKNVRNHRFWISRKLKKKFYIKVIKCFDFYPHNGCRKKKIKRKKFKRKNFKNRRNLKGRNLKRKKFKKKKWLSGLKRQIVNLLSFLIVGSNPTFFIF